MNKKARDILMGICCYLAILILIPVFCEKRDNKFVWFHVNQGAVLLIGIFALRAIELVLSAVFGVVGLGGIAVVFSKISIVVSTIYIVLGILSVVLGKMAKLPIIGEINLIR